MLRISDQKPLFQPGEEGRCRQPCQPSYISVSGTGSLGMRLSSRDVGRSAGKTFGLSLPPAPTSSSKGLRGPPVGGSRSISDRGSRGRREVVAGSSGMSDDDLRKPISCWARASGHCLIGVGKLCRYAQCSWRSRLSTSCRGGLWSAVAELEYVVVGGLSTPCLTRPPLSHRPALPCPACPGAPLTAGLHGPYGQLLSSDVPPPPTGFAVLGTKVPRVVPREVDCPPSCLVGTWVLETSRR